ncbi:hypothetical protein L3Y34_013458 [Caenorhabditis briggsae]|uniref:F-box domain-containing protein n=2 Tax=Caenorhabditis briggsae TaxID=6238 RepID=A0AAE8ZU30_CAEBR|nr:hypothetical protein L3Y34_013458 [Caenorhabditis briggsae]
MNRDFSKPNLDTMPNNALKEILNYLNIKERSVLRKVNRTLREAVDNNHTSVDVVLDFWNDSITLKLDEIEIEYGIEDEDKYNDGDSIGQVLTMIDVNTITSLRINCDGAHLHDEEQFLDLPQWESVRDFRLIGGVELPDHILNALRNVSFFNIDQDNDNMEITFESIFMFILSVLNRSDNFEKGQITSGNLDIPAPFINAHLILGNVSVTFEQNRITMEKCE